MNKPLIIRLNETKSTLISVINNAIQQDELPCYLLEPMVSELYAQIREGARSELQMAQEQMKQEEITNTEE